MLYNLMKYIHILSSMMILGGQFVTTTIYPKVVESKVNIKSIIRLLAGFLVISLITGFSLMHIAGFDFSDFWIKYALIFTSAYITLLLISYKSKRHKYVLWWISWSMLPIILVFMVTKPEF